MAGCYVNTDAEPSFESVEILSPAPGERVLGGTSFSLRLQGRQLWGREVRIEVTRTAEGGAREVVDTVAARFDEAPDLQTATASWILDGDFLDRTQVSDLSFVAKFQEASAESTSVTVSTDPRLEDLRMIGATASADLQLGQELSLEITGRDLAGRTATVQVHRVSQDGAEVVRSEPVAFDRALEQQTARFVWIVDGNFADRPGRNELYFRVTYGAQSLQTQSVFLDVYTTVGPLTVLRNTPDGLQATEGSTPIPYFDALRLRVEGAAMVGQDYTVDARVVSGGGRSLERFTGTAASRSFEVDLGVSEDDFPSGVDSLEIVFEVRVGTAEGRSNVVVVDLRGILDCAWYDAANSRIPVDTQFDEGVELTLRAQTWGLEGEAGYFNIYEDDPTSDDFLALLNATGQADRIERTWTTLWTGDGFAQSNNEYYFEIEIAGRTCRSQNVRVRKP